MCGRDDPPDDDYYIDAPDGDDEFFEPDPETEWTCDACGCVLPRFHKDFLCGDCAEDLRALKSTLEWKYPYYRED